MVLLNINMSECVHVFLYQSFYSTLTFICIMCSLFFRNTGAQPLTAEYNLCGKLTMAIILAPWLSRVYINLYICVICWIWSPYQFQVSVSAT